jgi:hypothetical protein
MKNKMRIAYNGARTDLEILLRQYPHYHKYIAFLVTPRRSCYAWFKNLGCPIYADNGAFNNFSDIRFHQMLNRLPEATAWVAVPDVVGNATETLAKFHHYAPLIHQRLAFVGQDGQEDLDLPDSDCFFIGGSTEWKLSGCARGVVDEAKARGMQIHMGRVNSEKRIRYAYEIGCNSVDGTGISRFSKKFLSKYLHTIHGLHSQYHLPILPPVGI